MSLIITTLVDYSTNFLNMIIKTDQKVKYHIISILKNKIFQKMYKTHKDFIVNVLLHFLSIKGKINFLQLARYSSLCEQTFRNNFEQDFDFLKFNKLLADQIVSNECIVAFDPCYIPKSGKETYGRAKFWSGSDKAAKWGLDICGFAVVDVIKNTAFHLKAFQTPGIKDRDDKFNLLLHYASLVSKNAEVFKSISKYLVADAFFSKKSFLDIILEINMHFISRLRDDSVLMYIFKGELTGKKGRPKKFDGRIDIKNLNTNYFDKVICNQELTIYSAIVYCKAFKRDIKLAVAVFSKDGKEVTRKLYFSTDLEQDALQIVPYYRSRFQIEFLYRDAKQHTGLTDCQARSENKLDFHFNTSLTAVNLAKFEWLSNSINEKTPFSMVNYKTLFNNTMMLDRFICRFAINPNTAKNQKIYKELLIFGNIAA